MRVGVVARDPGPLEPLLRRQRLMQVAWCVALRALPEALASAPVDAILIQSESQRADDLIETRLAAVEAGVSKMFLALSSAGGSLLLAEVVDAVRPEPRPGARSAPLTARQMDVLARIDRGQTNREIAAGLGVSQSTVNRHVEHILERLHVRNRALAVAWLRSTQSERGRRVRRSVPEGAAILDAIECLLDSAGGGGRHQETRPGPPAGESAAS